MPGGLQSMNTTLFSNLNLCADRLPSQEEKHTFHYLEKDKTEKVRMVDKALYSKVVQNFPIPCVDVFLFNPDTKKYLLVLRRDPPAKDFWWIPGGRIYKGETFEEAAMRKCSEELSIDIKNLSPVKNLGIAETFFPDSAWGCQTHTINTLFFVIIKVEENLKIDDTCQDYKWLPIDVFPNEEDVYIQNIYRLAIETLKNIK